MQIDRVALVDPRALSLATAEPCSLKEASEWVALELSKLLRREIQCLLEGRKQTNEQEQCVLLGTDIESGPAFAVCAPTDPATGFTVREYGMLSVSEEHARTIYVLPDFHQRLLRMIMQTPE